MCVDGAKMSTAVRQYLHHFMVFVTGELTAQLKDSGAKYVITQAPFINKVKQAVARVAGVQVCLYVV